MTATIPEVTKNADLSPRPLTSRYAHQCRGDSTPSHECSRFPQAWDTLATVAKVQVIDEVPFGIFRKSPSLVCNQLQH